MLFQLFQQARCRSAKSSSIAERIIRGISVTWLDPRPASLPVVNEVSILGQLTTPKLTPHFQHRGQYIHILNVQVAKH
jgi:hypothetical protein